MDHSKLFKVLVAGGAALAAGCGTVAPNGTEDAQRDGPDAGGALEECGFCPNEMCCVTDESGTHTVPGLMCCWGTSC